MSEKKAKKERKVKCPVCGSMNEKDESILHSGRYYCPSCYEAKQQSKGDMYELYDYICEIFNIEIPTGMIMKQIKEYKEEYSYTYKGMFLTLKYWIEILKKPIKKEKGVAIIPYLYDQTRDFYIEKLEVEDHINSLNEEMVKEKIIYVKQEPRINTYKNKKIIDISQLKE